MDERYGLTNAARRIKSWKRKVSRSQVANVILLYSEIIASRVLQIIFRRHLARLPLATRGLHGIGAAQQYHSSQVWAKRYCDYCAELPLDRVHCYCCAPAVSRLGYYFYAGWVWKWTC